MVRAAPFRGLRFDPGVVGNVGRVLAPPYDVLGPDARDTLAATSAHNMVHLTLDGTRQHSDGVPGYQHVAGRLADWIGSGALALDPEPALYVYEQSEDVVGTRRVQRGVLAEVPLDPDRRWILPHERTLRGPVDDRLRLLRATQVDLSPVFGLYAGAGRADDVVAAMTSGPPVLSVTDVAGAEHRLWVVTDRDLIGAWQAALASEQVLIADGHHRYRTALGHQALRRGEHPEQPDGPWDRLLMLLVDGDTAGPAVRAIHRLLRDVDAAALLDATAGLLRAEPVRDVPSALTALEAAPADRFAVGLHDFAGTWVLHDDTGQLTQEVGSGDRPALDVEVLHGPVLRDRLGIEDPEGRIIFEAEADTAAAEVAAGRAAALVLLRPVTVRSVLEVARNGVDLPQKTTFFRPKPRDGLVLRPLQPEQLTGPST